MKVHVKLIILFLIIITAYKCDKNEEIIKDPFANMYGEWKLYDVTGGVSGNGHEMNFDILIVEAFDKYSFIKNEIILEQGVIVQDEQDSENLFINFQAYKSSDTLMYDHEKYVVFTNSDTLHLNSPCCDRYNYHLVRQ